MCIYGPSASRSSSYDSNFTFFLSNRAFVIFENGQYDLLNTITLFLEIIVSIFSFSYYSGLSSSFCTAGSAGAATWGSAVTVSSSLA